jgi:hypothetical protein
MAAEGRGSRYLIKQRVKAPKESRLWFNEAVVLK